jgi:hypothetical protein
MVIARANKRLIFFSPYRVMTNRRPGRETSESFSDQIVFRVVVEMLETSTAISFSAG